MADSPFRVERGVRKDAWSRFVATSPEATAFATADYLDLCGRPWEGALVYKGDEARAGILLLPSADGTSLELDDLVVYGGLMHAGSLGTLPAAAALLERFRCAEAAVAWLSGNFRGISLACSPALEDLRPFQWHGYHDADPSSRFALDLRYTAILDLPDPSLPEDATGLWAGMDGLRRRNIREGRADGAVVRVEADVDGFLAHYRDLMAAQGREPDASMLARMGGLVRGLLEKGLALQTTCRSAGGDLLYTCVWLVRGGRAIYLFGAGPARERVRYQGTLCFWESFGLLARDHAIRDVDMEGINSPNRGAFKLSFGGRLAPYFELHRQPGIPA
jgi:hypothetical protein